MNKAISILLFWVISSTLTLAQDALLYEVPFKLPSEVNSEAEEAAVLVSPDGEALYFSRIMYGPNTGGIKGGQDVWSSSTDGNGGWYLAEHNLLEVNNKGDNAVIGISEDGNTLYLLNKYKGNKTVMGVSVTTSDGDKWSEPTALAIPGLISNSSFYGFNMDPTGQFLIISMSAGSTMGKEDLYVSKNEGGKWSAPIHLGNVINSEGYEITPYLTADMKSIYFSSNGRGGYGDADIYKSDRLDDTWTNWSEPVNMGDNINSAGFDAFFSITSDNRIFFCSNRNGMLSDVFQSKVLERLVIEDEVEFEGEGIKAVIATEDGETVYEATVAKAESIVVKNFAVEVPEVNVAEKAETEAAEESAIAEETASEAEEAITIEEEPAIVEEVAVALEEEATETEEEPEETVIAERTASSEEEEEESESTETVSEEESTSTEEELSVEETVAEEPESTEEAAITFEIPDSTPEYVEEEVEEVVEEIAEAVVEESVEEVAVVEEETVEVVASEPAEEAPVINDEPLVSEVSARREVADAGWVYFDLNSSYFSEEEGIKLKSIYDKLNSQPSLNLEVLGYSDNLGEEFYNMWISERRASRVIEYLIEQGISSNRLSGKWFGEANPVASCDECSDQDNQKNRRVELIFQ